MSKNRSITMDDIAELAKVSKPTVSRALSNSPLVNDKTRAHVLEVAREHGYAVNRNAQKLRHKRTNTVAVSLDYHSHQRNHISDPFIFELLAGVSEALGDASQDLLLMAPSHNDTESFRQMLMSRGADGLVFLGQGHREATIEQFARTGAPLVVWGARRRSSNYCVVGSDNFLGGQLAGRYFLERGRCNFLFVGDISHNEVYWRHKGLMSVAGEQCGTSVEEIVPANMSYEASRDAATAYLASRRPIPDAIFTYNDTAAMAFVRAFADKGIRIPGDVSVVGYNDIPSAGFFSPPLTTIRQNTYQAGRLLVRKLMQIIDGKKPRSEAIKTELIVRAT